MMTTSLPLLGYGFLLGWSVAWPPGPINAEIARRCLARGLWAGIAVLLGACTGDAMWAIVVALGFVSTGAGTRAGLAILSVVLLLTLAFVFLRGAWRSWRARSRVETAPERFSGRRAGYLLGLTMALTSPWNIAFWLAAIGRPELIQYGKAAIPVIVVAVIAGAFAWGLAWSLAVSRAQHLLTGRTWDITVKALTGVLMLVFAIRSLQLLLTAV